VRTGALLVLTVLLMGILSIGCISKEATGPSQADLDAVKAQLASAQSEIDSLKSLLSAKDAEIETLSKPKIKEITINPGKQLKLGGIDHVIEAFEAKYGIKVNVPKVGGCGYSSEALVDGTIHLGAFCCPLNKDETGSKGLVDLGAVGRDAIVFVVNKDNPVNGLTTQQLRDIYQGRITNWKEVGGNDAPIEPYAHIMCGGREEVMRQYLVGVRDTKAGIVGIDNSLWADNVVNIKDETDNVPTVAANPNAIVPVSRSMVDDTVKIISVDGVFPTDETIADESYPVVRYLHMGAADIPEDAVKLFIDFLRSDEGQKLLAKEGKIVPLPS